MNDIHQTCPDSRQLLSRGGVGPTVAASSSLGYGKVTERLCEKENVRSGVRPSHVTIYTILVVRHKSRLLWPCTRSALFVHPAVCRYAHHDKAIWSYSGLLWRAAKCEGFRRTIVADTKHHHSFWVSWRFKQTLEEWDKRDLSFVSLHPLRNIFKKSKLSFLKGGKLNILRVPLIFCRFCENQGRAQVVEYLQMEPISPGGSQWEAASLECSGSN